MALWIIGGILLLLILLLLLRVGVHLRFGEQLELTVIAGPARIQLLPRPEKTETEQKTKQKKKAKGEAQEEKEPAKQREKLSLSFEDIRSALPYLWEGLKRALARTRRRMRIDPLRLSVIFAGEDPAAVAQCDRVIWLEGGAVAADGPPATVLPAFRAEMARIGEADADTDLAG